MTRIKKTEAGLTTALQNNDELKQMTVVMQAIVNHDPSLTPELFKTLDKLKTASKLCPGCEFIRLLSDDGSGYCHEHGDINGGVPDEEDNA